MCIHTSAEAEDLSPSWDVAINPAKRATDERLGNLGFEEEGMIQGHPLGWLVDIFFNFKRFILY